MKKFLEQASLYALITLLVGCSGGEPQRVEVSGKVHLDGQPLPVGTIRFVPGAGRPVSSEIRPDGSFELVSAAVGQAASRPGVVPGLYRVAVSASEIVDEDAGPNWIAPARYADHRTSGLEVIIDEPTKSLVIELKSESADETGEPVEETNETDGDETDDAS